MAVKTSWAAGDVLTAADLTDTLAAKANLASPTFTGTPAAPTAAVGTNTTQIATTAFVMANSGLVYITKADFSASQSIVVNNCFTSIYDNYMILMSYTAASGSDLTFKLRASGTNAATNYNYRRINASATTVSTADNTAQTAWQIGSYSTTYLNLATMLVSGPALAAATTYRGESIDAADVLRLYGGVHTTATAYDGFNITPDAAINLTGSVYVYGLRKA